MSYHYPQNNSGSRFLAVFTIVIVLVLGGCLVFSVVRNIRGLAAGYPGLSGEWQAAIAVIITAASFVLAASSILKTFDSTVFIRAALLMAGLTFSAVSFALSFAGVVEDNKNRFYVNALADPEVLRLEDDLDKVIGRQDEYGISESTKRSLMQREKEIRKELSGARDRARHRADVEAKKAEQAAGKMSHLALGIFALIPEIGILVFSLLLVLITGASVFSGGGIIRDRVARDPAPVASAPEGRSSARMENVAPSPSNNGQLTPEVAENNAGGAEDQWDPFK